MNFRKSCFFALCVFPIIGSFTIMFIPRLFLDEQLIEALGGNSSLSLMVRMLFFVTGSIALSIYAAGALIWMFLIVINNSQKHGQLFLVYAFWVILTVLYMLPYLLLHYEVKIPPIRTQRSSLPVKKNNIMRKERVRYLGRHVPKPNADQKTDNADGSIEESKEKQ